MTTLAERLKPENLFPGEMEAIEAEFCGTSPVALHRLGASKRDRLLAWLRYPTADRERAFHDVKRWAGAPIAAGLDLLQNPTKYQPKPKAPSKADATYNAIGAWLREEGEL